MNNTITKYIIIKIILLHTICNISFFYRMVDYDFILDEMEKSSFSRCRRQNLE